MNWFRSSRTLSQQNTSYSKLQERLVDITVITIIAIIIIIIIISIIIIIIIWDRCPHEVLCPTPRREKRRLLRRN